MASGGVRFADAVATSPSAGVKRSLGDAGLDGAEGGPATGPPPQSPGRRMETAALLDALERDRQAVLAGA